MRTPSASIDHFPAPKLQSRQNHCPPSPVTDSLGCCCCCLQRPTPPRRASWPWRTPLQATPRQRGPLPTLASSVTDELHRPDPIVVRVEVDAGQPMHCNWQLCGLTVDWCDCRLARVDVMAYSRNGCFSAAPQLRATETERGGSQAAVRGDQTRCPALHNGTRQSSAQKQSLNICNVKQQTNGSMHAALQANTCSSLASLAGG